MSIEMKPSVQTIRDIQLRMLKPGKKYNTIGQLLKIETLPNSKMGNPRFVCAIDTACAYDVMIGKTKSDVMWAYLMPKEDTLCNVVFHITKAGNIVFDYVSVMR